MREKKESKPEGACEEHGNEQNADETRELRKRKVTLSGEGSGERLAIKEHAYQL
jgi:hypothetical protein